MARSPRRAADTSGGRAPTLTEQARREQIIRLTIGLIAEHGYAGTSLARIAAAASISKAAVLYHFDTKNAVIRAAYDTVMAALTEQVAAAIHAADSPAAAVEAYISALIGHMDRHPDHTRMIVEALDDANATGIADTPDSPGRRQPLAKLIEAAKSSGEYRDDIDPRTHAIILSGAIDAVVAESLADPRYSLTEAAQAVIELTRRAARS
ncbi:TetR/AcrR family transcriptional regulator [Allonocardiopsis opalescens]|uniref:TetR family transcriptional regulator n=1 Tax=Allonocardiopsis opalescens TaxID=1144618 RepID=A0A2T0Q1Q0_9ACTN|nr:TetR/AcrR family transcriptional regulator [Allonocardiopsis opalescens]PRX97724.1 TetR family transcriptional regulator [Allonocardiopsis opalescens]